MSQTIMTPRALGAALYFDTELYADPAPFVALVRALFGESSPELVQWTIRVDGRRMPPPKRFALQRLLRTIAKGETYSAAVESPPRSADADHALVHVAIGPEATLRGLPKSWRYDFDASFGSSRVEELGAERIVEQIVAFADAVAAKAGLISWCETARFAACLSSVSQSSALTEEQSRRVSDEAVRRSRWGDIIRGPAWGTFLSARHVETIGIAELERVARVRMLRSGGAFLQTNDEAELARVLAPVSSK